MYSQLEVKNTRVGAFLVGLVAHIRHHNVQSNVRKTHFNLSALACQRSLLLFNYTWEFELKSWKKNLHYRTIRNFVSNSNNLKESEKKKGIHTFAPWSKSMRLGESWQAESEEKKWDWNLKTRAMKLFDGKENVYILLSTPRHTQNKVGLLSSTQTSAKKTRKFS